MMTETARSALGTAGMAPCPTPLGFGTATLLNRLDSCSSLRMLKAAQDAGINYFDTARSYGFGQVERILGDLLRGQRDRLIVATKLGIEARPGVGSTSKIVGPLARMAPPLRRMFGRGLKALTRRGVFSVSAASRSLETSLREMRTDYVDILLLHMCEPADVMDELLDFLEYQVRRGTIRRYGLATSYRCTAALAPIWPELTRIIQLPALELPTDHKRDSGLAGSRVIVHSSIRPTLRRLKTLLGDDKQAQLDLARQLELPSLRPDVLAPRLLACTAALHPESVVLFSCRNEAGLFQNVDAVRKSRLSPEQAARFRSVVDEHLSASGHRGNAREKSLWAGVFRPPATLPTVGAPRPTHGS